ncbi:hypothetical protein SLA2020_049610 [Shorea laevis]
MAGDFVWLVSPTLAHKGPSKLFHGPTHVSNERVKGTLELTFKLLDSATPILLLLHLEVKNVELLVDIPHGQLPHGQPPLKGYHDVP